MNESSGMLRQGAFALLLVMAALSAAAWLRSCSDDGGYGHRVYAQSVEVKHAAYGSRGGYALPDPEVTPGAVDPRAIADPEGKRRIVGGIERDICAADFRTGPIRAQIRDFARLKKLACKEYGVAKCDGSVEGDHLISIELGGCPDCLANIWPQPMKEARVKDDQVERMLPKLVCSGQMTLETAQRWIAHDWVAAAERWGDLK